VRAPGIEIDLATTDAARALRDELRSWLAEHLTDEFRVPALRDPTGASGEQFELRRAWQRVLHSGGWAGPHWPREYGGRGVSVREYAVYLLECARVGAPDPVNVIGLGMVGPTLIAHGTPAQQGHLAGILSAEEIWCQLFSEPDAGSDLGAISTRAVPHDDGGWIVNGQKVWTSWGTEGDRGLLLARTGQPGFGGLSCFLIDLRAEGVTARGIRQVTGDSHFSEVFLDGVRLPADALVGELDHGWSVASGTLTHERTTAILPRYATTLAAAAALLEVAGRTGATGSGRDEAVRLWSQAQTMVLAGYRGLAQAEDGLAAPASSLIQRLRWGLLNQRIFELAADLAGWAALDPSTPLGGLLLAARGWTIGGGTSQIQRNMLAERVLGLPREVKVRSPAETEKPWSTPPITSHA
jgi:alkylation response protein AidB-like acyl-CoA dehydrogenase